jgi:clan AA aspartic protease
MILGHVRDNLPRVTLSLPGVTGQVFIEFVVDTGFDGELALPSHLVRQLEATFQGDKPILLADSFARALPSFEVTLEWEDDSRPTEILALEGVPLLGSVLLAGSLLQAEMTDGGEVSIEPL